MNDPQSSPSWAGLGGGSAKRLTRTRGAVDSNDHDASHP
jgi:hypothetical protein